ncbi:MAG: citrate lyase subunit beta / citryl-CoA lyase [Miltoncostaeaceae bacterium]|jgi:citrate lyase subunit beta/citryl-CoA lyase|nr:citrate lyase subunit beta / citryl-CoA lyase [Miltoncostaeaceae bacterium]
MLQRAPTIPADLVFLDLEDSVVADAKGDEARQRVVETLLGARFQAPTVGVRINAVDTRWCLDDLQACVGAAGERIDVVILPKVEDESHVRFADHLLALLERGRGLAVGSIGLEAQIESARGLVNVERIAAACPRRLEALVFGPGDYAASLGMPQLTIGAPIPDYPGDAFHYPLSRIAVAARANGLQAIDGPYAAIRDLDGLRRSAERARALGYDGKWSVHPGQVEPLNAAFGVSQEDFDRARAIVDALAEAAAAGRGAAMVGGEMIDEASRRLAQRVMGRGLLAGMGGSAGGDG